MDKTFVTDVELEYKKTEASLAVIVTTFLIAFALVLIVFAAGLGVIYTIYKGVMMLGITNSFLSLAVIILFFAPWFMKKNQEINNEAAKSAVGESGS